MIESSSYDPYACWFCTYWSADLVPALFVVLCEDSCWMKEMCHWCHFGFFASLLIRLVPRKITRRNGQCLTQHQLREESCISPAFASWFSFAFVQNTAHAFSHVWETLCHCVRTTGRLLTATCPIVMVGTSKYLVPCTTDPSFTELFQGTAT